MNHSSARLALLRRFLHEQTRHKRLVDDRHSPSHAAANGSPVAFETTALVLATTQSGRLSNSCRAPHAIDEPLNKRRNRAAHRHIPSAWKESVDLLSRHRRPLVGQ